MTLPVHTDVNTNELSKVYRNTSATYKFYWFISIIDIFISERRRTISFWDIIIGMIAEAWYPIHYFHLSFGKSDSLYNQIMELQRRLYIPIDATKSEIKRILRNAIEDTSIKSLIKVFSLNVPYRFLSPWIRYENDLDTMLKSQDFKNDCLYAIKDDNITINPIWDEYLLENYRLLKDYTFWNLTLFIQKRNPNVPDVPSKLRKPVNRESLTRQHKFWDTFIELNGFMNCIYTGKKLYKANYDLDHFVPWSFVSHNLIWNLLPADSAINSSKSNNLPPLGDYLEPFAISHQKAIKVIYEKNPNEPILEDYLTICDSLSDITHLSENDFLNLYKRTFNPIVQIAENIGFTYWERK